MKAHKVIYTDCGEEQNVTFKAWDCDHAEDKFWDWIEEEWGGSNGIEIVDVKVVRRLMKVN